MHIPSHDEETVRIACAEMATQLNCMRDEPHTDAMEVVNDAAIVEAYISNGHTVAIECSSLVAAILRHPTSE